MAGIGDYVHYKYENYKKYGLNRPFDGAETNNGEAEAQEMFNRQRQDLLNQIKKRENKAKYDTKKIETELNYYYGVQKGGINNMLSKKDLENMHQAIQNFLGSKLDGVTIDYNTLKSAVETGDFDAAALKAHKEGEQSLYDKLSKLGKLNTNKSSFTSKEAISRRITLLLEARDALASDKGSKGMVRKIDSLAKTWAEISEALGGDRVQLGWGNTKNRHFVEDLNDLISKFLSGSSTMHGEYAEALIVLMNYMVNTTAAREVGDLYGVLQNGAGKQRVAGQDRSSNALLSTYFNADFVDLKQVTSGSVYKEFTMQDGAGNNFKANPTQDKVDVYIDVNGLSVPASVKNYNMANVSTDVHLLSGRSVLQLIQEYEIFANHYLNVVAEHGDSEPSGALLQSAHEALKMTVLLKALAGGVITSEGRSDSAELFIVNDNSVGGFKVFLIGDILDKVENNINLLSLGDYDSVSQLANNPVGDIMKNPNEMDARTRITNLLMQLHAMKLSVSLKKEAFS